MDSGYISSRIRFPEMGKRAKCRASRTNRRSVSSQAIFDAEYFAIRESDDRGNFCDIHSRAKFARAYRSIIAFKSVLLRELSETSFPKELKESFLATARKSCIAIVLNGTYHSSFRYYSVSQSYVIMCREILCKMYILNFITL